MFASALAFLLQASMLYLLVAMFILLDLLLLSSRAKRMRSERVLREVVEARIKERRKTWNSGASKSAPEGAPTAPRPAADNARQTGYGTRRQPVIDRVGEAGQESAEREAGRS